VEEGIVWWRARSAILKPLSCDSPSHLPSPARDPQKDAEDPVLRMILWVSVRLEPGVPHYDTT